MRYSRLIDLTLPLRLGEGSRPITAERGRTEQLTVHVPVDHPWYIMHRVQTITHVGTHIEAPFHCVEHGRDLGGLGLEEQLVGEAVIIDLSALPPRSLVGASEIATLAGQAGGIKGGDIVFFHTGYANLKDTPRYDERPSLTAEAMNWLVERGVKLVGTDLPGLEGPQTPGHLDCHLALLGNDVPFIENLTNLDALSQRRVFVCALPVPIHGLEAFPLRVIAFEE